MTTQTGRILVVDDDPFVVEMLAALLEEEGHAVDKAENGREALAKYSGSGGTALIISDMNMPEMDGLELTREIRKATPHVPIIILTASGELSSTLQAMECGAKDYLVKDENIMEIIADTVGRAINSGSSCC